MVQWWLYKLNANKLLLYSQLGCSGEVSDIERKGSRHVKVTLYDGAYFLRKTDEYVFSHGNLNSIRCPDDIMPVWRVFIGNGSIEYDTWTRTVFTAESAAIPEKKPRVILGDSLTRGINIPGCRVACFPGATAATLARRIDEVKNLSSNKAVLVHVGTNDIQTFKERQFKESYTEIVKNIKNRCPGTKILLTSILPRPTDFLKSCSKVEEANNIIRKIAVSSDDVKYVRSEKRFLYRRPIKPIKKLFGKDGLHLSDAGHYQLKRSFTQALNHAFR